MQWLENMVLQTKLMLLAGFMMVALGLLGFMSYTNLTQWRDSVHEIGVVKLPSIVGVLHMRTGINQGLFSKTVSEGSLEIRKRLLRFKMRSSG